MGVAPGNLGEREGKFWESCMVDGIECRILTGS